MVLLCGIPTESPLELVQARLQERGTPHLVISQRRFADISFGFEIHGQRIGGALGIDGQHYPLDTFTAVYTRLMDDQQLPEVRDQPAGSAHRRRARAWHDALSRWLEIAPIRVVTRTSAMASNASKPYQAQVIARHGFRVPETLVTSDPDLARRFAADQGRVIFKSISGVRSIVRALGDDDLRRLDRIRACPVQFQQFVPGRNVRVHTVGGGAFATAITTDATDYRYARAQGEDPPVLEAVDLSDEVAARAIALAAALDLPFAGIDLKITPDGEVYCFEVNPSPAYSYYESHTGQPISDALARYLAGEEPPVAQFQAEMTNRT